MLQAILMRHKLSKLFEGLGIVFLVAGIFLYWTFWYFIFGFACLFIGTVLILLTTKNWKFKLLTIGIPLTIVGYSFYSSFTTPEMYLIPNNYKGPVVVIFNQKDGQKKEYEGRRRLYRIPLTSFLFTQFKDEQGWIDQDYYYVSPNGQRKMLGVLNTRDFNEEWTLVKNAKEPPRDSLAVFNPGTMGTMGNSGDTNSKVFLQLWVGSYNDTLKKRYFSPEYIDSLKLATKKNGLQSIKQGDFRPLRPHRTVLDNLPS
ncbi:MAG: hypothetical protein LH619_11890 [Chitinophagaceae bacterium]|nr:hypothetical protein [Chitinophagaceae bacterium]